MAMLRCTGLTLLGGLLVENIHGRAVTRLFYPHANVGAQVLGGFDGGCRGRRPMIC